MKSLELNSWVINQIREGKVILFLGSGATVGAKTPGGKPPLSSEGLRDLLSVTFLNGEKKDSPLAVVSDFANSISSLRAVQEVVCGEFINLEPADFHSIIPRFRWRAIFTTNYDLVIEKAYENCRDRLQTLAPVLRNDANLRDTLSKQDVVPYIKLHGCVTRIDDPSLPLILASEQYAKYEQNRTNLFELLREYGQRFPIFFCGYRLEDPNIQQIFFDLNDQGINRPRYVLVRPNLSELDNKVWSGRRFDVINASFETFLRYIDSNIDFNQRKLSLLTSPDQLSIARWFKTNQSPSTELVRYFETELDHVHSGIRTEGASPRDFYHGLTHSWDVFRDELDVRRNIIDDLLLEWVLDEDRHRGVRVHLLRGYAGSGKNVTLRRTAWEAATEYDQPILFLKEGATIRNHLIHELHTLIQARLVLFVDDIVRLLEPVLSLLDYAKRQSIELTLIAGARTNEWNVYGADLAPMVIGEQVLHRLSEKDIEILLAKLEEHDCLGHLKDLSHEERLNAFTVESERQLLVALHEATSGKKFPEHVHDEYRNIVPDEARILYLDICTLHRLGVPVRAGLVHRVSGISFTDFENKFFKPLEHVVRTYHDHAVNDFVYRSRHPLIARFVFQNALSDPERKVEQIIRMLRYLNVEYASDEVAFSALIEGKSLASEFSDRALADKIYKVASETGADPSFIAHQQAVFENRHKAGNPRRAMEYIRKARKLARFGILAIEHTQAMILRNLSAQSKNVLEKKMYREEARDILLSQIQQRRDPYAYTGLAQVYLDELKEVLSSQDEGSQDKGDGLSARVLVELIAKCEQVIDSGLQRFPEESVLLSLRSDLANLLHDKPTAKAALEEAFNVNPRNEFVAVRLARIQQGGGHPEEAISTLKKCLLENPHSKMAHFSLARIYIELDEDTYGESISHHLYHSFTQGDSNYLAQLYYARHEFLHGNRDKAEEIFNSLRGQRLPPRLRSKQMGVVADRDGKSILYRGTVNSHTNTYCFVRIPALQSDLFIYYGEFSNEDWGNLFINSYIECALAFTLRGPCGVRAKLIN